MRPLSPNTVRLVIPLQAMRQEDADVLRSLVPSGNLMIDLVLDGANIKVQWLYDKHENQVPAHLEVPVRDLMRLCF